MERNRREWRGMHRSAEEQKGMKRNGVRPSGHFRITLWSSVVAPRPLSGGFLVTLPALARTCDVLWGDLPATSESLWPHSGMTLG